MPFQIYLYIELQKKNPDQRPKNPRKRLSRALKPMPPNSKTYYNPFGFIKTWNPFYRRLREVVRGEEESSKRKGVLREGRGKVEVGVGRGGGRGG